MFFSSTLLDATLNNDGTLKIFIPQAIIATYRKNKKDRVNERLVGSRILIKPSQFFPRNYLLSSFLIVPAIQDDNLPFRF